jgi:hypothetical protein
VAIYPKEGTFWTDHPVGVVEREWVTDDHRAAAKDYVDNLLARPQQERAMRTGFRPADEKIPLAAPLDAAHGIDPDQPKAILPVPSSDVMKAILALWRQSKKHAQVALVLDCSGSMRVNQKMLNAQKGALEVVKMLGDAPRLEFRGDTGAGSPWARVAELATSGSPVQGRRRVGRALVNEQPALAGEATGVAGEAAVRADDAVAGNDDRDRVASQGEADGAGGPRHPDATGQPRITDRGAERDRAERIPDAALELGPAGGERHVEAPETAREVGGELLDGGLQRGIVADPEAVRLEAAIWRLEVEAGQGRAVREEQ